MSRNKRMMTRITYVVVALLSLLLRGLESTELHAKKPSDEDYPLPLVPFILHCVNAADSTVKECGDQLPLNRPELTRKVGRPPVSYNTALQESPYRTTVDSESVISFVCCYVNEKSGKWLAKLPKREKNRPYVIWMEEHGWTPNEELTTREDVIFFGFDLRDYALVNL